MNSTPSKTYRNMYNTHIIQKKMNKVEKCQFLAIFGRFLEVLKLKFEFFRKQFLFHNLEPIIHKVTRSREKSNEFYKMTPRIAHS